MAAKEKTVARVMVMLDCLLDTRLGTLAKIDQKRAAKVLESGTYHTRESDIFPGFTKEEFDKAYAERDVETLEYSTLTECVRAINNIVKQLRTQSTTHHYQDSVEIVVNCYPYQLDKETLDDMGVAIAKWINFAHSVKLVYIPYEQLTPSYVDAQYGGMFIYDYDNWWNHHVNAFRTKLIPHVHLWSPSIWFKEPPSEEELLEYKRAKLPHPMQAIELLAGVCITLQLLDIRFFSIADPTKFIP